MKRFITIGLLSCAVGAPLAAQQARGQTAAATTPSRSELPALPTAGAVRASSPIRIDGRLDDAAWADAPVITGFRQLDPNEGELATEQTEVRVLYDGHALYIGARLFDSEPDRIIARLSRRDEGISGGDLFEVYIDSYHDKVSGFLFRITPAGAIRDATINATGGQDASWDGVWESAASIDSLGWVAELRIPFSQLRYTPRSGTQSFGIDFRRVVPRKSETSAYAFTPKRAAGGPSRWATLGGLSDLPRSRNLELMPYVTSRAEYLNVDGENPFRSAGEYRAKAGLDLRYGLTSGVTLSGTINPDFGQVEVDPARVNLTANELFFPERRPFFVEGAEIFRYGRIRTYNSANFPTLFHSRRIGRPPQRRLEFQHPFADMPDEATIAAAAKITGQPRPGLSIGFLDALTLRETARFQTADGSRDKDVVEPRTNYFVGRVQQSARNGSTQIGLFTTAVNRDIDSEPIANLLRREAYFAGLDFQQSWRQRMYVLDGSFGHSTVRGSESAIASTQRSAVRYLQRPDIQNHHYDPTRTSLYGTAWQLSAAKMSGEHVIGNVTWQQVSPGFEVNDVGFQSGASYKALSTVVGLKTDKPGRVLRRWLVGPFTGHRWNFDGDAIDHYYGFHVDGELPNFWGFNVNAILKPEAVNDRLTRGGPLALRPKSHALEAGWWTNQRRVWVFEQYYNYEKDAAGGWYHDLWTSFSVRPSTALRVSVSPSLNISQYDAQFVRSVADTAATGTLGRRYVFGELRYNQLAVETRVDWTFTPRLSLQVFAQPLVADGEYRAFKSLRERRTYDFDYFRETDGTLTRTNDGIVLQQPGGTSIDIGQPDFNTRSLVGNAVLRWEYRPGSTLFFVWQQRRSGFEDRAGFAPGRDLSGIFREPPENVFAIKASYWFAR